MPPPSTALEKAPGLEAIYVRSRNSILSSIKEDLSVPEAVSPCLHPAAEDILELLAYMAPRTTSTGNKKNRAGFRATDTI